MKTTSAGSFPPAAFPYQQLQLSEATEKPPACSGCAPGNRKAGFYCWQGNATEVSSNAHPSACAPRAPVQETGEDVPPSHCCLDSPASQKPSAPFTDGGTTGALQMCLWHVSKPGSRCHQQPPRPSARRGLDTCPGVQLVMQKHPPSWINAVTLTPAPSRHFSTVGPCLLITGTDSRLLKFVLLEELPPAANHPPQGTSLGRWPWRMG